MAAAPCWEAQVAGGPSHRLRCHPPGLEGSSLAPPPPGGRSDDNLTGRRTCTACTRPVWAAMYLSPDRGPAPGSRPSPPPPPRRERRDASPLPPPGGPPALRATGTPAGDGPPP